MTCLLKNLPATSTYSTTVCTKNEQLVRNGHPEDGSFVSQVTPVREPKSLKSYWPDMPSTNKNGAKLRSQLAANIGKGQGKVCEKESKGIYTLSRYKYKTHTLTNSLPWRFSVPASRPKNCEEALLLSRELLLLKISTNSNCSNWARSSPQTGRGRQSLKINLLGQMLARARIHVW